MSRRRTIGTPVATAIQDAWQRLATADAIEAVRNLTKPGGAIPPGTPVGRLSDSELGWIVAAVLFAWISTRATQATSEGLEVESAIRTTGMDPDPWDVGAVAAILPDLAKIPEIDWSKPLSTWPREDMMHFLTNALGLVRQAEVARGLGGGTITRKAGAAQIARQANAAIRW